MYSLSIIPLLLPGVIAPGGGKKTINQYKYQCQDATWTSKHPYVPVIPIVWNPMDKDGNEVFDKIRGNDQECRHCKAAHNADHDLHCVSQCHPNANWNRNECAERGRPVVRERIQLGCPYGESREECGMFMRQYI